MQLKVGAATDVGRVRPINEDAYLARPEQGLFVVCDGMGGAASGEVASQIAVKVIGDLFDEAPGVTTAGARLPRSARLGDAVCAANDAIYDHAEADKVHTGMGTTVVSAWIEGDILSLAHVGDSRAYLWHDGQIEPVTSDHSLVEAQVRAGLIDREQSLTSVHQNVLLRALGRELDVEVELDEVRVSAGDCLLLCSDGLTRMVPDAELADTLARFRGDPQGACAHLIAAANAKGGPDNITVVIVEVFD
ncbi:MAG: Stp1/IreP family PP2C-type Ser/Thr phosphatase [Vicinamibacterales bacterium]|jgi:protein phosphatase